MTHIFIGCDKIFGQRNAYFKRLSALELTATAEQKLTPARLDQYRTESPKGFAFVMHAAAQLTAADPVHGVLANNDKLKASWEATMEMARKLSPKMILMRTPMAFAPGQESIERLESFASQLAVQAKEVKAQVAWEPHGLWQQEQFVPLARKLGMVPVFDPFVETDLKPGRGTALFALYNRRGLRATFNDFDMEDLMDHCAPYQRAIVIFRGTRRFRDARLAYTVWQASRE